MSPRLFLLLLCGSCILVATYLLASFVASFDVYELESRRVAMQLKLFYEEADTGESAVMAITAGRADTVLIVPSYTYRGDRALEKLVRRNTISQGTADSIVRQSFDGPAALAWIRNGKLLYFGGIENRYAMSLTECIELPMQGEVAVVEAEVVILAGNGFKEVVFHAPHDR